MDQPIRTPAVLLQGRHEFLLGRHIAVKRFGYSHHGILSSEDGSSVIHYTKGDGPGGSLDGVIKEETFEKFLGKSKMEHVQLVEQEEDESGIDPSVSSRTPRGSYTREEIAQRARHYIGFADYNLFGANCESFAHWCVTDQHYSKQIEENGWLCRSIGIITGITSFLAFAASAILLRVSGVQTKR